METKMPLQKGYTLFELIIVVGLIGMLASVATLNYTTVRMKGRDAVRIANLRQLKTGLLLYNDTKNGFPVGENIVLGGSNAQCLDNDGFSATCQEPIYISRITGDPLVSDPNFRQYYTSLNQDGSVCDTPSCSAYAIDFVLEIGAGDLGEGRHLMTAQGWE